MSIRKFLVCKLGIGLFAMALPSASLAAEFEVLHFTKLGELIKIESYTSMSAEGMKLDKLSQSNGRREEGRYNKNAAYFSQRFCGPSGREYPCLMAHFYYYLSTGGSTFILNSKEADSPEEAIGMLLEAIESAEADKI